tara:strand:- start:311 stop:991 length:681 start_codon:yes stop_codon:yes gene_type:complete
MKVVLDIETIPCDEANRSLLPKAKPPPSLVAEREGMSPEIWLEQQYRMTALDGTFGRIVCIGMLRLTNANEAKDAVLLYGNNEAEILAQFWHHMRTWNSPYLITHNGLSFDLPFIWKRSVIHHVTPSMEFRLARFRTDAIYDTMMVWANWDMRNAVSLGVLSKILGFEGKSGSGNQVFDMWSDGKLKDIAEYCFDDTYLTYGCYCRMKFITPAPPDKFVPEYVQLA